MSRFGSIPGPLFLTLMLLGANAAWAQRMDMGSAPLRDPQVVVHGTGLLDYLNSVGELIDPARDQVLVELFASTVSNNSTFTFQLELAARLDSTSIGIYNGHDAAPAPYEVFPAHARAGWFAVASYRTNPTRMVVNTFDELAIHRSTRTYLGADRHAVGFYASGPQGTVYSQDHRNPGGTANVLHFKGTGLNSGNAWIAIESLAGPDSDADFDDSVLFYETVNPCVLPCGPPTGPTLVRRARWGEVKSWFR